MFLSFSNYLSLKGRKIVSIGLIASIFSFLGIAHATEEEQEYPFTYGDVIESFGSQTPIEIDGYFYKVTSLSGDLDGATPASQKISGFRGVMEDHFSIIKPMGATLCDFHAQSDFFGDAENCRPQQCSYNEFYAFLERFIPQEYYSSVTYWNIIDAFKANRPISIGGIQYDVMEIVNENNQPFQVDYKPYLWGHPPVAEELENKLIITQDDSKVCPNHTSCNHWDTENCGPDERKCTQETFFKATLLRTQE